MVSAHERMHCRNGQAPNEMGRQMKRAKQGPGVVNALMQGNAHAVRDMGACEDQCEKMEGTPGGKRQRSGQKEGGLKTMVLRAAAHK